MTIREGRTKTMTLDELFNNAKCNTQDAGYEEGHVSHRKNGDFIKQGGSWVPMKGQKQEAGKEEAGADEQTMRQSLINFMTKGAPHVPEADAKKAVEGLPADTLNEMFNNLKEQHGDKYLAQQEAAPEKSKDDAYMDEQGLHDIYMDIKNNELEDYTVEEIAKEYRITKGDAEIIKNRIENNKRAKEQDKQDRKDQAATQRSRVDNVTGSNYKEGQRVPNAEAIGKTMRHKERQYLAEHKKEAEANPGDVTERRDILASLVKNSREQAEMYEAIKDRSKGEGNEWEINNHVAEELNRLNTEEKELQGKLKKLDEPGLQKKAGAGIPEADEKTFVGKTYKDFAESARASGYSPKTEKENPDGSSSTTFKNKEGKSIRVDFDKNGKIQKVEAAAGSTESKEDKLNKIRTVHSSEKLGNGQTIELTESKKNGMFYVKIDGKATATFKTKENAQKEYDAIKSGKDPEADRHNAIASRYNEKHPDSPMETRQPQNRAGGENKTFTFTKAGHVYNVPASSPAEAVQKLKARGVKGFKESDAFDDSTPRAAAGSTSAAITPELREKANAEKQEAARKEAITREWLDETGLMKKSGAGSTEGWASKAFTTSQKKQMEKLGFKANGDSWVTERNGHKYEIKVNQQNNPYMSGPTTSAELYIDGDKRPYQFGGEETIDPNSMVKLEKALKEQGYNNLSTGRSAPKDAAPKLTGDCKVKLSKIKK